MAINAASSAFGGYGPPRPSDVRPCAFAMDTSLACALAALAERPRLISAALCGRVEEMGALASMSGGTKDGDCWGDLVVVVVVTACGRKETFPVGGA